MIYFFTILYFIKDDGLTVVENRERGVFPLIEIEKPSNSTKR
jgi:hypothetical protein